MSNNNEILIAIWDKGHDPLDSLIKLFTKGRGTHAAFIRQNGKVIENFYPHVRERNLTLEDHKSVAVYSLRNVTRKECERIEKWFDEQLKHPPEYSIRDLFRYALDLPPIEGSRCFCSQWVLRGLRLNVAPEKQPLVRLEYPDFAPPANLETSPYLIESERYK